MLFSDHDICLAHLLLYAEQLLIFLWKVSLFTDGETLDQHFLYFSPD